MRFELPVNVWGVDAFGQAFTTPATSDRKRNRLVTIPEFLPRVVSSMRLCTYGEKSRALLLLYIWLHPRRTSHYFASFSSGTAPCTSAEPHALACQHQCSARRRFASD